MIARSLLLLSILVVTPAYGEVRLPKILGSHMVLQRDCEVRLWGWADAGETVQVSASWLQQALQSTANDEGQWELRLRTGPAGGPHRITIRSDNSIQLDDILFGEVWLASGQSNMEMPLKAVSGAYTGIKNAEQEIAAADHPRLRLFQAGNFSSKEPLDDVRAGITMYGIPPAACRWTACSPLSVPTFSSTAYFFARELQQRLDVPIGIIDASWGGTSAETWTPAAALKRLGMDAEYEQAVNLPQKADQKIPSRLYNGMIHPLRRFRIRGAIWYQGEGNAGRADKYRELFSTMIGSWRDVFGEAFPFYYAQIAPYNYRNVNAALLREAQLQTLRVPKTGMAVTMDIGNLGDIHPKNKQEVGRRLALWALAQDYGQQIAYSGPIFSQALWADGRANVQFEHASGLRAHDGQPLRGFELAGRDRKFYPATARIEGDRVVVHSEQVAAPVAVRYGFQSDATPNLANGAGLPASSFRSDDW